MRSQMRGAACRVTSLVVGVVCMLGFPSASGKDGAETGPQCESTSECLHTDELERFGIRFRAEQAADVYHMTLSVQPSICIQAAGRDCGTTTFELDGVRLVTGDKISTLETAEPNEYQYTSRFKVAGNKLNDAELRLIYRGEHCAAGERAEHTFIIDLENAVENAPDFFF